MNKLYFCGAAAIGLLALASCSQEEITGGGNDGATLFQIQLPDNLATRASFGEGTTATNLYVAIYKAGETTPLLTNVNGEVDGLTVNNFAGSLTTTVSAQLVKNESYDLVFWAESGDAKGSAGYTFDVDAQSISVDYNDMANFTESRDAFCKTLKGFVSKGEINQTVVLTRPFAQINIGTDDLSAYLVAAGNVSSQTFGMTVSGVANTLSLSGATPTVSTSSDFNGEVTVTPVALPSDDITEDFPVSGYKYLDMGYFLVGDENAAKTNLNVTLTVGGADFQTYASVPAQMNYRTNIYGSLLTNKENFNVEIDPIFNGEHNVPTGDWSETNGEVPVPVDNVYSVSTPEQLAAIAKAINGGSQDFDGKTIKLTADIDLGARKWTPIGTSAYPLKANFDGGGYTISNLYVDTPSQAGLIAYGWREVSNLTVENAVIKSNHWAGVIMGYCTDHANRGFNNITVRNSTVTLTPNYSGSAWDNGDKGGAIIGYYAAQNSGVGITDCTIENVEITAYRDAGGVAGYSDAPVSNCSVTNSTITLDGTNAYDGVYTTVAPIVGRGNTANNTNNTYSGITTGYTNFSGVTFAAALNALADNTLSVTNCNVPNVAVNTAANSTIIFDGNTFTAPSTQPDGNNNVARFDIFVNAAAADYTLNITNNDFKSAWSHAIYVQGNNRNATSITVTGNKFADWGKKETATDATAKSGCIKLYNIPNYSPATVESFAALPAAGQAFVRAFFAGGNTWTIPSGAAYTVVNMSNVCFTQSPE